MHTIAHHLSLVIQVVTCWQCHLSSAYLSCLLQEDYSDAVDNMDRGDMIAQRVEKLSVTDATGIPDERGDATPTAKRDTEV